jgi:hypothetical protein
VEEFLNTPQTSVSRAPSGPSWCRTEGMSGPSWCRTEECRAVRRQFYIFFTVCVTSVNIGSTSPKQSTKYRYFRLYETKMTNEDLRADLGPLGIIRFGLCCRDLPSLTSSCQFLCRAVGVRIILLRTVLEFLLLYHLHIAIMCILVQCSADLSGCICGSSLVILLSVYYYVNLPYFFKAYFTTLSVAQAA